MTEYAKKTCYDCGVRFPANTGYRVTESYDSGRSDRRPDAANVAGFLFSDAKTSRNMLKGAFTKNNRRKYTRNRTVRKCKSCAGYEPAGDPTPKASAPAPEPISVEALQKSFDEQKKRDALKAEMKSYKRQQPLSTFAFLSNVVLGSLGGITLLGMSQQFPEAYAANELGALFGALLIVGLPMVGLPVRNLFFREYNRLARKG